MAEPRERVVFGSYNSTDRLKVEAISADLETWGVKLWLDTQLQAGQVFGRVLEAEIQRAVSAVVFIGAERGPWQELEIFMLLQKQVKGMLAVLIPVLLEGAGQNAGGFLSNIEHVDFRTGRREAARTLARALLDAPGTGANKDSASRVQSQATVSRAIVKWMLQESTDRDEVERIAERYASRELWQEAILACGRLRNIALEIRSTALFAQSCEMIGRIHFLAGEEALAERDWAISRAIVKKFAEPRLEEFESRVVKIRQNPRRSSGKIQPASTHM